MPFFSSYTLQHGDLYKMSNLPAFKIYKQPCTPSKKQTGNRDIYLLGDSYFNETKDDIIAQIGQAKFDDMKNKCSSTGWPSAMYNDIDADSIVDAKMNQLKMYPIAAYQHKYNGNVFDRYVILEVPYAENADWDATVTWEGSIYFIIKESDVEQVK